MRFDLSSLNPGTWFFFNEENEKEGGVCLRVCPAEEQKKIEKKVTKTVRKFLKNLPYESKERDDLEADLLLWDYVIVDWKEVNDVDGHPLPCDKEHKSVLMGGVPEFSDFVVSKLSLLKKRTLSERELEKN